MSQSHKEASLWGGGFSEAMHPALAKLSESMAQDLPLGDADLRASAAYARALGQCGVLGGDDAARLSAALDTLRAEFNAGTWISQGFEDIHTAIEAEVTKRLGELGERLHTGRSRNDQVATAFRLTVAAFIDKLVASVRRLQSALVERAETQLDTLLPSYTHLQRAQPIRLSHWLLAHFWPLERDVQRLLQARERTLVLPLGSGAVSGHPFGLDRTYLMRELGFLSLSQNSIDAVGDREFALEFGFATSMVNLHLSRLAEELVVWTSAEFGYVRWPDALATGSSLMPNKKNPDLAELVRGRVASSVGDMVGILMLIKSLPVSYQRDFEETKAPVWRMAERTIDSVDAMQVAMANIRFDAERMRAALTDDTLATEAADVLVAKGVPFRQAHRIVAALVAAGRERNVGIKALAQAQDFTLPQPLTAADIEGLDVTSAIERRSTRGGTARSALLTQIQEARACINQGVTR